MSDAETWGIVLRDRASGAEQWVACEVTRDGDIVTARAHGYGHRSVEYAQPTVEGVGRLILQHDRSLALVCIATPAKYAAHMESVRRALVADEVERLRAEVANHEIASTHLRAAMTAAEVASAPRWLAPYLRPSPPTVEQIEAHRDRLASLGVSSWWWVWFAGDAPMRVSFRVSRPENYVRALPKGEPPWAWGCWPDAARTLVYATRSLASEELRDVPHVGRAFVAPCDVVGNPMEWP